MASDLEARLAEVEARYEAVSAEMAAPETSADPEKLRTVGKAFSDLEEIVRPYREFREVTKAADDARELAKAESDPEMEAYFREEAERAEARADELRAQLELLLVPKDPNDGKDVVVEIRGGAGGQEAALWAGELYEMYAQVRRAPSLEDRGPVLVPERPRRLQGGRARGPRQGRVLAAEARVRRPPRAAGARHRVPGPDPHVDRHRGRARRRPRRSRSRSVPRTSRSTSTARADRAASP